METKIEKENICSEKLNYSLNESFANDTDENISPESLTKSNILEFNKTFEEFVRIKSESSIDRLNRCLALLASSMNPADINPANPEIATLFINLYELMNTMESRSALLWSSVALLEQAILNSYMRTSLVQRFKFMQVLAKLLESVSSPERALYILRLLENLSYGISITWQEPYLSGLIKTLVKFIDSHKEDLKVISLSVLINLCYKNLPSVYVLMRTVSVEQFLNDIQSFGILACKMSFLLENGSENVSKADVHNFIGFTFSEVLRSLKNFNSGLLRHTVDFFLDMKKNETTKEYFQDYSSYYEDINKLIKVVNQCTKESNSDFTKDITFDWPTCLGILLDLLDDLIKSTGNKIKPLLPAIVNSTIQWINSDRAGTQSLQLLTTVMQMDDDLGYFSHLLNEITTNITQTLMILKTIKVSTEQINALLKLVTELINQGSLTEDLNISLKSFIFDLIFPEFFNTSDEQKTPKLTTDSQISVYIRALSILVLMADRFPEDSWKSSLEHLFKLPIIHFFIAKAILSDNAEVCSLVFGLSKVDGFPASGVSKNISSQGPVLLSENNTFKGNSDVCAMNNFTNSFINVDVEKRLNELITKLLEAHENKEIGNVLMSDVMELFELKMAMCSNAEKDLLARLDECNAEVTTLSHKVALLSAEVSRYQTQTFFLQMTIEKLKAEAISAEKETIRLTKAMNNYENIIDEEKIRQAELIKKLEQKNADIKALNEKLLIAASKVIEQDAELKYLRNLISIEQSQSQDLEKRIENLEELTNQLKRQILEKQHCIISHNKEIEDLAKENSALEEKLNQTEVALAEKENLLENYAKDLRDVEEMRTQVVSIIQGKGHPTEHLSSS